MASSTSGDDRVTGFETFLSCIDNREINEDNIGRGVGGVVQNVDNDDSTRANAAARPLDPRFALKQQLDKRDVTTR